MDRMGWTAKQYYEENTPQDINRLLTLWQLQERVEEMRRREAKMKAKMKEAGRAR
jgi:hypothetical protein